jgi:hypothetical protein
MVEFTLPAFGGFVAPILQVVALFVSVEDLL